MLLCPVVLPNLFLFLCFWYVDYTSWPWSNGLLQKTSHVSQQQTPLSSPELYALVGALILGSCGSFSCIRLTAVGDVVGIAGPGPVGCQALPGAEATGHWLLGLGHEMAGHGKPGDPWGADGLSVCVPGPAMADSMTVVVMELVSAHWWLWPRPIGP